jgi:hypothetical protein
MPTDPPASPKPHASFDAGANALLRPFEIVPGRGLGGLRFGASKSEVFAALGFPEKSYLTDDGDRAAQYHRLRLELTFEHENGDRLGWIEVHNRDTRIFGVSPWTLSQREAMALFADRLSEPPEHDDYGSFESYFFEGNQVELQFQFGELDCINFGVTYDDELPRWPEQA